MTDRDTDLLEPVRAGRHAEPPDTTGLPDALAAAAPRRWWNRATPALLGLLLLAGGFLGGVAAQQRWGTSPAATSIGARPPAGTLPSGGTPGGTLPSGGPGLPPGGADATAGTLVSVTGNTLTLRTPAGGTVTVKVLESTRIRRTTTLAQLRAGQPVTVQGSTAADGTVTASAVTAS